MPELGPSGSVRGRPAMGVPTAIRRASLEKTCAGASQVGRFRVISLQGFVGIRGPEPYCMTRPVSEHDQPHIRSPLETAAPTSRLRRAGAQGTRTFLIIGI